MNIARIFRSGRRDQQDPVRQFVHVLLAHAVAENASAIVFGIPHDIPWDFDAQRKEELEGLADAEAELKDRHAGDDGDDEPFAWPPPRDGFLAYPNGTNSLPVWFVINGERRPQTPFVVTLYGRLLTTIAELLTSFGGNDLSFIEIPSTVGVSRRFVNVRQTMERDNTVTLHVLGVREVGPEVPIGPAHLRSR